MISNHLLCLELLTPFFGTCQSGKQAVDGEWDDAESFRKHKFGSGWVSQPEELEEGANAIMLASYLLDFVSLN